MADIAKICGEAIRTAANLGAEDSVKSFYDVAVLFADGRMDAARKHLKPHQN